MTSILTKLNSMEYFRKVISTTLIVMILTITFTTTSLSAKANLNVQTHCTAGWGYCIQDTNNYFSLVPIIGTSWFVGTVIGCSIGFLACDAD